MRAVLFDLDGTLLDIDLDSFLRRYFHALGAAAFDHFPEADIVPAILASTSVMQQPHDGRTNRDVFYADFAERTGIDLHTHWEVFHRFYAEQFPLLGDGCGPAKGARRAMDTAFDLGLEVVVATQPIFPIEAIRCRLGWAGLADFELSKLTTYETMHACKPSPDYFTEAAAMAGCQARECIMVGDDRMLDMAAADCGMATFYVGPDADVQADWAGDLDDLAELLPRLLPRQTGTG